MGSHAHKCSSKYTTNLVRVFYKKKNIIHTTDTIQNVHPQTYKEVCIPYQKLIFCTLDTQQGTSWGGGKFFSFFFITWVKQKLQIMLTFLKKQDIDYCVIDLMKLRGPTFANAEPSISHHSSTHHDFSNSIQLKEAVQHPCLLSCVAFVRLESLDPWSPQQSSSSIKERERENTNISGCSFL